MLVVLDDNIAIDQKPLKNPQSYFQNTLMVSFDTTVPHHSYSKANLGQALSGVWELGQFREVAGL